MTAVKELDRVVEHMRLDLAQRPPSGIKPLLDALQTRYGDAGTCRDFRTCKNFRRQDFQPIVDRS